MIPPEVYERAKTYTTPDGVEGVTASITVPIAPSVIDSVSAEYGVAVEELETALTAHQADLVRDETRIGYLGRLLETGVGEVLTFTDETVYLSVGDEVWEDERRWLEFSETLSEAVQAAHTQEVSAVSELVDGKSLSGHGYVVSIDFPLRSTADDPLIPIDPYPIAERAEFLRFQIGMKERLAYVRAFAETLDMVGSSPAETRMAIASVLDMTPEEVASDIETIREWRLNAEKRLEDLFGHDSQAEADDVGRSLVFERVASLTE